MRNISLRDQEEKEHLNDESESSSADDSTPSSSHSKAFRVGLALVGLCAAVVCMYGTGTRAFSAPSESPVKSHGILEAPEFTELLQAQTRGLLEKMGAPPKMKEHIDNAIVQARNYVKARCTSEELETLNQVKLTQQDWHDLRYVMQALNDTRVQKVGQVVLAEIKENSAGGPTEIGEAVQKRLAKDNVPDLAQKLLPAHLRQKIKEHFQTRIQQRQVSSADVWPLMLDPTGDVFGKIRANSTTDQSNVQNGMVPSSAGLRRLREGTWNKPTKLNGWELAEGITSVVFISIAELLLHIDLIVHQFKLPVWLHSIFFVPAYALGAGSCFIGLSFWCQFFLGALGLNAIDAILIVSEIIPRDWIER